MLLHYLNTKADVPQIGSEPKQKTTTLVTVETILVVDSFSIVSKLAKTVDFS